MLLTLGSQTQSRRGCVIPFTQNSTTGRRIYRNLKQVKVLMEPGDKEVTSWKPVGCGVCFTVTEVVVIPNPSFTHEASRTRRSWVNCVKWCSLHTRRYSDLIISSHRVWCLLGIVLLPKHLTKPRRGHWHALIQIKPRWESITTLHYSHAFMHTVDISDVPFPDLRFTYTQKCQKPH